MKIPKEGAWTFENKEIAEAFDNHVEEQLPWYKLATDIIVHICRHYIPKNGLVYDIGASTGNIGIGIRDILEQRKANLIALEPSEEMRSLYQGGGQLLSDLAEEYKYKNFDVAICFLSLMFIPVASRYRLISELKEKCNPGGVIIIFDKMISSGGYPSLISYRLTLVNKIAAGAKAEDIIKKELSLSGVQRPIDPSLLQGAIEIFRIGDFAGWIIEQKEH